MKDEGNLIVVRDETIRREISKPHKITTKQIIEECNLHGTVKEVRIRILKFKEKRVV